MAPESVPCPLSLLVGTLRGALFGADPVHVRCELLEREAGERVSAAVGREQGLAGSAGIEQRSSVRLWPHVAGRREPPRRGWLGHVPGPVPCRRCRAQPFPLHPSVSARGRRSPCHWMPCTAMHGGWDAALTQRHQVREASCGEHTRAGGGSGFILTSFPVVVMVMVMVIQLSAATTTGQGLGGTPWPAPLRTCCLPWARPLPAPGFPLVFAIPFFFFFLRKKSSPYYHILSAVYLLSPASIFVM